MQNQYGDYVGESGKDPIDVQARMEALTITHTAVTVGATTTELHAANTNRRYLLIVNDSDATIYVKIGAAAVMNQGIRLNANGGSYEMSHALGNLATGAVNAISAAGSKIALVTEGV